MAAGFVYSSSPEATDVDPPTPPKEETSEFPGDLTQVLLKSVTDHVSTEHPEMNCLYPHPPPSVTTPPSALMKGKKSSGGPSRAELSDDYQ